MIALKGNILPLPVADDREQPRWKIHQLAQFRSGSDEAEVIVTDLSQSGVRIECSYDLAPSDRILMELPIIGPIQAVVIWRDGRSCGCRFLAQLPSSALYELLFIADTTLGDLSANVYGVTEIEIGTNLTIDEISDWKHDFEREERYRTWIFAGLRRREDGTFFAIIKKQPS